MKTFCIALGVAVSLGAASPALADGHDVPPTCIDAVNTHYGAEDGVHHVLHAPLWAAHALICHVFHHDYGPTPVRG